MNTRRTPRRCCSRTIVAGACAILVALPAASAYAEPTEITVRVLSRGAKFVGSSMGGASVTLTDVTSGALLASGVTRGSTGDTRRMMHRDGGRDAVLASEGAAGWTTTLDLERPTLVEVAASGPLAQMQAAMRVTARQWVVPGKHLNGGNGWLLELPGFAVDVLAPPAHVKLEGAVTEVELRANVTLMCGCPVEPDGLWNADGYEVAALVSHEGEPRGRYPLTYAGSTSQFSASIPTPEPGLYVVTVYAYDPANGNTGVDHTTFFVP
ncbi:MAG: hypothetical protein RLW61_03725 [Gammaproteobacteria bacterium]